MDLYLMHYYIQRGHSKDEILSLSEVEKMFYIASMQKQKIDDKNKWSME